MTKNKLLLVGSTIVSLFAVFVASISTFAWFQVNTVEGQTVNNTNVVSSDSTDLNITNVTGYKYKYEDVSYGVIDYSRGSVINYSSESVVNGDKELRGELDVPTEGEGYYLVGNVSWINDLNHKKGTSISTSYDWKYKAGLKLTPSVIRDGSNNLPNIATYDEGIYLTAGTQFKVRYHSVSTQNTSQTKNNADVWYGAIDNTAQTTTAAQVVDGNIKIKVSAYYRLFFTSNHQVSFYKIQDADPNPASPSRVRNPISNGGVTKKNSITITGTKYAYLNPGKWNSEGSPHYYLFVKKDSGNKYVWTKMTSITGFYGCTYRCAIPTKYGNESSTAWDRFIFVRYDPSKNPASQGNDGWDGKWNQTDDITDLSSYGGGIICNFSSSSWDTNAFTTTAINDLYAIRRKNNNNFGTDEKLSVTSANDTTITLAKTVSLSVGEELKTILRGTNNTSQTWYGYSNTTVTSVSSYVVKADNNNNDNNIKFNAKGSYTITVTINAKNKTASSAPSTLVLSGTPLIPHVEGYINGSNVWDSSVGNMIISSGTTNFTYDLTLIPNDQFVVVYDGAYYKYSNISELFQSSDQSNNNFKAKVAGTFRITFNAATPGISSVFLSAPRIGYGTAGGDWEYIAMNAPASGTTYTYSMFLDTAKAFKIVYGTAYYGYDKLATTSMFNDYGSYHDIQPKLSGTYNVSFDTSNASTPISVTLVTPTITYGAPGAQSWTNQLMTRDGSTDSYTYSLTLTKGQAFKVMYASSYYNSDNLNTSSLIFTTDNDKNIICTFAGTYTIAFDISTHNITIASTSFTTNSSSGNTTYYLEASGNGAGFNNGSNAYGLIAYDSSTMKANFYPMSLVFGSIYQTTSAVTTAHTHIYFVRYDSSNANYAASITRMSASIAKPVSADDNWFMMTNNDFTGSWAIFYGAADTAYYLVGNTAFAGSGNGWKFVAGKKMSESNLPTDVVAYKTGVTLSSGMKFQIWHNISGTGRADNRSGGNNNGIYNVINGNNSTDPVTNSIVSIDGSDLSVGNSVTGTFTIYLTKYNKIFIRDENAWTNLYTKVGDDGAVNTLSMGESVNYYATYENGIHVSNDDATSGTYIGIVRESAGTNTKTGYGSDDLITSYSFVIGTKTVTLNGVSVKMFKITKPGYYNIYLKNNGKVFITTRPYTTNGSDVLNNTGDDGYYIIPYNATYSDTTSFKNGYRMATMEGESAGAQQNYAYYDKLKITSANEKYYIRSFFDNVESGPFTGLAPKNADNDNDLVSVSGNTYVFSTPGVYNIYLYNSGTAQSPVKSISIVKYSLSNFTKLNGVPSSAYDSGGDATNVKAANTTLVLDVTFTTTKSMDLSLNTVITTPSVTNGLSGFVKYKMFVMANAAGNNETAIYNYFRDNDRYSQLVSMSSNTTLSHGTLAAGTYHAYIVIDYDPTQIINMPADSGLPNDFYFIMKLHQTMPS